MILNCKTLAEILGIDEDEAQSLMERKDFPSTQVAEEKYVVSQSRLEEWVIHNSKGYSGLEMEI